ncbi:MAG TPA: hypothetical protein V6C97_06075 [Oculatellaceae cyanobacterium]
MIKWLAVLTIFLCVLVAVPFAVALQVPAQGAVYTLPEKNGNIILLAGTTYSDNGATYLLTNTSEGQIYAWYFPMFSMGNGTTMLRLSVQDCNLTVTSFNSQSALIENNLYNRTRVLTCNVVGEGVAKIDFGLAINQTSKVYLDGVLKQQGDGWSYDDFGVTVTQPVSNVVIYSQFTDFVPPRDFPQLNSLTYAGIILGLIVATLIIFGMTEFKGYRHKKAETKPA